MKIHLFTLTSPVHDNAATERATVDWLDAIGQTIDKDVLQLHGDDYAAYGSDDLNVIYVRTGGTEGLFRELYQNNEQVRMRKVLLLTSGKSNSLAASMEILSWLRLRGKDGEILHGEADYVGKRLILLAKVSIARRRLSGKRLGIIGKPSDWLIASDFDSDAVRGKLGIETEYIEMEELLSQIRKRDYPIDARKRLHTCPSDYFIGALEIYGALKRIVEKHQLCALTLRCFDLLSTVHNTGCLALALLNQEGIVSSCEGDVPALLTMMISNALTGKSGFQANPSKINPKTCDFVFAHCTIPLNMVTEYEYDTHYESGIGVAIKGKMPLGEVTVAKVSGDLNRVFVAAGQLKENLREKDLCRTQVKIRVADAAAYFLNNPIGNHHIIIEGNQTELFNEFFQSLQ